MSTDRAFYEFTCGRLGLTAHALAEHDLDAATRDAPDALATALTRWIRALHANLEGTAAAHALRLARERYNWDGVDALGYCVHAALDLADAVAVRRGQ